MTETNGTAGNSGATRRVDEFAFDKEDLDNTSRTYEAVREGNVVVMKDVVTREQLYHEQDIPSIFLRGAIAGPLSGDQAEDPNFKVMRDAMGPEGVQLTTQEAQMISAASSRRHKTDPNYAGVLDSYSVFIIGKGFQVSAVDEGEEVADYLAKFMKVNKMDGRDRSIIEEVIRTGEVFIRKFTTAGEKTALVPLVRVLRYYEIDEILYDEKDAETAIAYMRPYKDANGHMQKEQIPAADIFHIKYGDQKRGLPPFMVIMGQCAYYDDWLFNRIVFNRLKTSYYLEEIVDGSSAKVTSTDAAAPDAIKTGQRGKSIKRVPKPGSKITHNKAIEYKWLKPEVAAEDAKEDGRAIRLSICAGAQVPEFVLGDASNANYASSVVAQNPFVRKMEYLQDFFQPHFEDIYEWAITYGIANGSIPRISSETLMRERRATMPWWNRIPRTLKARIGKLFESPGKKPALGMILKEVDPASGDFMTSQIVPTKTEVNLNWPTLIASDLLKDTQAYQLHQAMEIASKETLAQKLGYNWEEEQRRIDQEREMQADNQDPGMDDAKRDGEIDNGDEGESQ